MEKPLQILIALLLLERFALPMTRIEPNFWGAVAVWIIILGLVCWSLLEWEKNRWKKLSCVGLLAFALLLLWSPLKAQWDREHAPLVAQEMPKPQDNPNQEMLSVSAFVEKYDDGRQNLVVSATNTGLVKLLINRAELVCAGRIIGTSDWENNHLSTWLDPAEESKSAVPGFTVPGDRAKGIDGRDCSGKLSVRVFTSRKKMVSSVVKR